MVKPLGGLYPPVVHVGDIFQVIHVADFNNMYVYFKHPEGASKNNFSGLKRLDFPAGSKFGCAWMDEVEPVQPTYKGRRHRPLKETVINITPPFPVRNSLHPLSESARTPVSKFAHMSLIPEMRDLVTGITKSGNPRAARVASLLLGIDNLGKIKDLQEPKSSMTNVGFDHNTTEDEIVFTPALKADPRVEARFYPKQPLKVGRFVRKTFQEHSIPVVDTDIEAFVNSYRAARGVNAGALERFELVSGKAVAEAYLKRNYAEGNEGTNLGNSCMKYRRCQDYLKIYTKNEDKVQLLVLWDRPTEDPGKKVSGRALIWSLDDGRTFMDRQYVIRPADESVFATYARKEGWTRWAGHGYIVDPAGKRTDKPMCVSLSRVDFEFYPYMDTMEFLHVSQDDRDAIEDPRKPHVPGMVTNDHRAPKKGVSVFECTNTNGSVDNFDDDGW